MTYKLKLWRTACLSLPIIKRKRYFLKDKQQLQEYFPVFEEAHAIKYTFGSLTCMPNLLFENRMIVNIN